MINVIFMGKNKPNVNKALETLFKMPVNIIAVIGVRDHDSNHSLYNCTKKLNLKYYTYDDFIQKIKDKKNNQKNIDFIISYLFPKKIQLDIIKLAKLGCINFHPAPLPDFKGVAPYTFGILHNFPNWGVTAHHIAKEFDTGDIIKVKKFDIDLKMETSYSLEKKSQVHLLSLFKETIKTILKEEELPKIKQKGGNYYSMKDFEKLREIKLTDSLDIIDRKIRAFWHPYFPGAFIKIKNEQFFLINETILEKMKNNKHLVLRKKK